MTQLLQSALGHLQEKLTPDTYDLAAEFIENYEFGLAYGFIMGELLKKDVSAGDAEASLKAAALRMGRDWKPRHDPL